MRSRRNCSNDGAERTDDGRIFNARAAVTEKARSPSVVRRVVGMTSVDVEALRRRRCEPTSVVASQISECVDAVAAWMKSNRLQLNPAKTEVLWCATSRRRHQLPTTAMLIDGVPVIPVQNVRDHGIYIDGDLSMQTHVQRTTSSCFAALRQLRQIRRTNGHIPDVNGRPCRPTAGLREQHTGWHSILLNAQAAVSIESCRTADFPSQMLRQHY